MEAEKVKLFTRGFGAARREEGTKDDPLVQLEDEINAWLRKNVECEIRSRQIGLTSGVNIQGNTFINCTVAIFYLQH